MSNTKPSISHIYSFSSYDGDADDDSFISAQSKKHLGFCITQSNVSQVYSRPVLPHYQALSLPVTPPLPPPLTPPSHTFSQAVQKTTPICGDQESTATAELLSEDGDSDDADCTNSTDGMLSFDSAMQSQASIVRTNEVGRFDVLSSFAFFAPPSPDSDTGCPAKFDILSSIPFFSSQAKPTCDSETRDSRLSNSPYSNSCSNILERKNVHSSSDSASSNGSIESTSYSTPVLGNSISFARSISEESDTKELNMVRKLQGSTSTTHASTQARSTSSPSDLTFTPSMESIPTAVNFSSCAATHISSPIAPPSIALHKSSSVAPSLAASQELRSVDLPTPTAPFCLASIKASIIAQSTDPLLDDMTQSYYTTRIQELKEKLRSMEIKYYRQKCGQSLRKSMIHCQKVKSASDCDSFCSELSMSRQSHNSKVASSSKVILKVVQEIMCFNLLVSVACMIFVLYKDSLSKILRSDDDVTDPQCDF